MTLTDDDPHHRLRLGEDRYDDVADYVEALQAALRTHSKLSGEDELRVEIDPDGELGLVQRTMLR